MSSFQDERTGPCSAGWDRGEHSPWGGEAGSLPELGGARKYVALLGDHISSKFNIAGRRAFVPAYGQEDLLLRLAAQLETGQP